MMQFSPIIINRITDQTLSVLGMVFTFIVLFIGGYFIGLLVSSAIKRVFSLKEIENSLVRYGAMTTKLWGSVTHFFALYFKWFITVMILTATGFPLVSELFFFMRDLLGFLVFGLIGLLLGGVLNKLVKEILSSLGVEEWLKKHRIDGAFGGLSLSGILAGITKWYVVLLFVQQGTTILSLSVLSKFISDFVLYIPEAISGLLILLLSLLVARFTSDRIKQRRLRLSEEYALAVESVIVFLGVVMALPILFSDVDVSILTDSFRILVAGISIAVAVAGGLGLKEAVAKKTST
ncbi:MAG: hypothetical protein GF334_10605 [Candidatus Altiarchaeales archaeon]|nr:hypothetical protein [Candidatus Altiarchaeales archaeon]